MYSAYVLHVLYVCIYVDVSVLFVLDVVLQPQIV